MMTIEEKHMNKTNTGGPAFARPASPAHEYGFHKHQEGMTLRDYFAAKAMQGLMGRSWADASTGKFPENLHAVWATAAYRMADAMLEAREA
jgi:hypothetical protein